LKPRFGKLCCFVLHLYTYLFMKESNLFCFVVMRSTKPGCFRTCSWCLSKVSTRRGAWAWFHDVWTWGPNVLEYSMISSLKIMVAENFRGIEICLWCCWKYLDEHDLMEFIW
jgi:hypothetical protein